MKFIKWFNEYWQSLLLFSFRSIFPPLTHEHKKIALITLTCSIILEHFSSSYTPPPKWAPERAYFRCSSLFRGKSYQLPSSPQNWIYKMNFPKCILGRMPLTCIKLSYSCQLVIHQLVTAQFLSMRTCLTTSFPSSATIILISLPHLDICLHYVRIASPPPPKRLHLLPSWLETNSRPPPISVKNYRCNSKT